MSLLNFSVNQSVMGASMTYQAVEESFSLRNDEDLKVFIEKFDEKVKSLEKQIKCFDDDLANSLDFKNFYGECNKKIQQIEEILKNISKNPEVLNSLDAKFLITKGTEIKSLKKLLTTKKVTYNQLNSSYSAGKTSFYDKFISFHKDNTEQEFDEEKLGFIDNDSSTENINGSPQDGYKIGTMNQIEQETTNDKLGRIENLENKFGYINMICED